MDALGDAGWRQGFTWSDGERSVEMAPGIVDRAQGALANHDIDGFELFASERSARGEARDLADRARSVRTVGAGEVPELAGELAARIDAEWLVAVGGGRVIDVAKAVAAAVGAQVVAVPTTLSGAPFTRFHRPAAGRRGYGSTRPRLVLADPWTMTSLDEAPLRATAMNALAHGVEALWGVGSSPLSRPLALAGIERVAGGLDERPPDASLLALGAASCGLAIDSAGFGPHHALCQSLVRVLGLPHAETYAAMLPHTATAIVAERAEDARELAKALSTPIESIGERLVELAGGQRRLGELGADRERVAEAIEVAAKRDEVALLWGERDHEATLEELIVRAW